jgi:chromosome segregation protein
LIEEAVGIVKYKAKKAEAERKLEKTQMNLDRAEDIISELHRRIEPLKKQSEKAKKYLEIRDELKEYELNIYAHRVEEYAEELKKYKTDKRILDDNFTQLDEKFNSTEKTTHYLKDLISGYESSLSEINSKIYELSSKNEDARTQREILKIKYEQNKSSIEQLNEDNENIKSGLSALYEQREEIINALAELKCEQDRLAEETEVQKEAVKTCFELQDNFINRESEYKNLLYIAERCEENLKENEEKLLSLKADMGKFETDIDGIKTEIDNKRNEHIKLKEKNSAYIKEKESHENKINETLQKIKVLQSQLSMHKSNEEDMQGYGYAVKKIVQFGQNSEESGICGVLAEIISADDKYLKAISAAMGGAFRYVVVKDEKTASGCIDILNKNKWGRVTFMPVSVIRPSVFSAEEKESFAGNYISAACDLVRFDSVYDSVVKHVLGRVVIAKDVSQAAYLAKATKHRHKIVTLNGEVFMPGGIVIGGESKADNIAPLQRKKRIDEIKKEIDSLQSEYDKIMAKSAESKNLIEKTNKEIENLQNAINYLNIEQANITADYNNSAASVKSIEKQNEDVLEKLTNTNERKEKFLLLLSADADIEEIKNNYKTQSEKLNGLNIEAVKISENIKYTSDKLLGINSEINKNITQREQNAQKIQSLAKETDQFEKNISEFNDNSDLYDKQKIECKENYDKISEEKNNANDKYEKSNSELISLSKEKNTLNDAINGLVLKINNIQMKTEHIADMVSEDYQMEIGDLTAFKKPIENFGEYSEKAEEMKKTIKSFGSINVGALDEYKEVTERYEFLTSQRDDLLNAKKDIEDIIKDVEKSMADQFREQFGLIREEFDNAFKKLFGGGSASLIILDEGDLLNTGIDISAQPPGKKLKNISMLSGGEKAMTSIALLFAILKIKPAPFCVLDEIDAALDDNNVSLFAKYINEQRKNNQLIIITHKKRTMEVCDCLYGASMGNEGITKIVSLKLTS